MFRYRLRTLLILMAVVPVTIAVAWWFATDKAFASNVKSLAGILLSFAVTSAPVIFLAFVAACIAAMITKR